MQVQVDNRMRAWYQKDMSVGLLYTCSLGEVRPDCPVALIQNKGEGDVDSMKVIPCEHQLPQQRKQVRCPALQSHSARAFDGHLVDMLVLSPINCDFLPYFLTFKTSPRLCLQWTRPHVCGILGLHNVTFMRDMHWCEALGLQQKQSVCNPTPRLLRWRRRPRGAGGRSSIQAG